MGSCSGATVRPTCIHSLTATRFSVRQKEPSRQLGPQQPDFHPQRCPSPYSPAPQPAQNSNPLLMEQVGGPTGPPIPSVRVSPIRVLSSPGHYNLWGQIFPDHRNPESPEPPQGAQRGSQSDLLGCSLAHCLLSGCPRSLPVSGPVSSWKTDTGVSHKVEGLHELMWLTQVCPSGMLPLPSALANSLATFTTHPTPRPSLQAEKQGSTPTTSELCFRPSAATAGIPIAWGSS